MVKIQLEIEHCSQCPHFNGERDFAAYSDTVNWYCGKAEGEHVLGKEIKLNVKKFEKVKVPEWCPIKVKS